MSRQAGDRATPPRAPRRDGVRTTLRVPAELLAEARIYADDVGTSSNDALIRLAERGARLREREREVERLSSERRAAIAASASQPAQGELPSPEAVREAILAGRGER